MEEFLVSWGLCQYSQKSVPPNLYSLRDFVQYRTQRGLPERDDNDYTLEQA